MTARPATVRPTLTTTRLTLRPFVLGDAADVQRLANDRDVAKNTIVIPHPYPDGLAEEWIAQHESNWTEGRGAQFAIVETETGELGGSIGMHVAADHARAELGYWVAKLKWGRGFATEAARAVVAFGFDTMKLHRIDAHHLAGNDASGRVLQKVGMRPEGTLREHIQKWGVFYDIVMYGVLRSEYETSPGS